MAKTYWTAKVEGAERLAMVVRVENLGRWASRRSENWQPTTPRESNFLVSAHLARLDLLEIVREAKGSGYRAALAAAIRRGRAFGKTLVNRSLPQ